MRNSYSYSCLFGQMQLLRNFEVLKTSKIKTNKDLIKTKAARNSYAGYFFNEKPELNKDTIYFFKSEK